MCKDDWCASTLHAYTYSYNYMCSSLRTISIIYPWQLAHIHA